MPVKWSLFTKNGVLWDVTPCGSCKNRFRRNSAPPSSGWQKSMNYVTSNRRACRFEILTVVVTKVVIFRNVPPCSPYMNQRFGGKYYFHIKSAYLLACWYLVQQIFDPEDGGNMLRRNVGSYSDYVDTYPTRWQLSLQYKCYRCHNILSRVGTEYIRAFDWKFDLLHCCRISGFHGGDYEECRHLGYKNPVRTSLLQSPAS
jgi:hypothetical protein